MEIVKTVLAAKIAQKNSVKYDNIMENPNKKNY